MWSHVYSLNCLWVISSTEKKNKIQVRECQKVWKLLKLGWNPLRISAKKRREALFKGKKESVWLYIPTGSKRSEVCDFRQTLSLAHVWCTGTFTSVCGSGSVEARTWLFRWAACGGQGRENRPKKGQIRLTWHRRRWKWEKRVKRQENTAPQNIFYYLSYLFVNWTIWNCHFCRSSVVCKKQFHAIRLKYICAHIYTPIKVYVYMCYAFKKKSKCAYLKSVGKLGTIFIKGFWISKCCPWR